MPVTVAPFDPEACQPAHNGSILASGIMPPALALPVGTHYGLLKPGMGQEPGTDPIGKLYIPLAGEAELIADGQVYRLCHGTVYHIAAGTLHAVRQVGEADFVNVCITLPEPSHAG